MVQYCVVPLGVALVPKRRLYYRFIFSCMLPLPLVRLSFALSASAPKQLRWSPLASQRVLTHGGASVVRAART